MAWPKGKPHWNSGKTKNSDERVAKGAATFKKSIEEGSYKPHKTLHSEETKKQLSKMKKELYATGWEPICGRSKKYTHVSPIAGTIKVDGTWEVKVAEHLDKIEVKWVRNKKRWHYIRPDGREATYQPDFFVEDWNTYIEVKGYETELDWAKWSQFNEKLIVIKKKELGELDEWLKSASC